jgi:hypothetical protein
MDTTHITVDGTIIGGAIQLDQPINLPNHSRVRVTIVAVDQVERVLDTALAGLERLKREQPIGSGGLKFTREQLNERD